MSKAFFRFLRGELNGFYLRNMHDALNKSTEHMKAFLMDFNNQQFKKGMIDDEILFNIGKFAGVFLPKISQAESLTSIKMSDSKEVDGTEYSERGLFDTVLELFNYYHLNLDSEGLFYFEHTSEDETEDINNLANINKKSSMVGDEQLIGYVSEDVVDLIKPDGSIDMSKVTVNPPENKAFNRIYGNQFSFLSEGTEDDLDLNTRIVLTESYEINGVEYSERGLYKPPVPNYPDINTLATEDERSSLVGDEEVIGYIAEDEIDVLDNQGKVRTEKILYEVPEGKAYSEYYGNQFLFLSESEKIYEDTDPEVFFDLYKALQHIRYNGASIKSLAELVSLVCPDGLIKIKNIEVAVDGTHINVYYDYDSEVAVTYKGQRKALFETLVGEKFKQVVLVENEIKE